MNYILENTVNAVVESSTRTLATLGRAALHSLAPDNFEYYMCSLELLNSQGVTRGFMTFAVLPNNLMETKTELSNITKTNRGIVTLFNDSFAPRDISIQGTFGRKIRLLIGDLEVNDEKGKKSYVSGNTGIDILGGQTLVKTGYGLTKMLKNIIDYTNKTDEHGRPHILLFNNYLLNTHYIVEVLQSSFSQSTENNMLWYYSMEMKAVAPASAVTVREGNRNINFLTQVSLNLLSKTITSTLTKVIQLGNVVGQSIPTPWNPDRNIENLWKQ